MTIEEFVRNFKLEIDQLWVKDAEGNYITAPGDKEFINVEICNKTDTFADLIFTV